MSYVTIVFFVISWSNRKLGKVFHLQSFDDNTTLSLFFAFSTFPGWFWKTYLFNLFGIILKYGQLYVYLHNCFKYTFFM